MTNSYTDRNGPSRTERVRASRSAFQTASLILGILAIVTFLFVYTPFIFGGLSIIFALIAKDEDNRISKKGKIGLACSIIGMIICVLVIIAAFVFVFTYYGSLDNFMNEFMDQYTYTMDLLTNTYQ